MKIFGKHRWWVTRVLVLPLHILVFAMLAFFLVRLIPGDPVLQILKEGTVTPEEYAAVQASLGLQGSIFDQFLRYIVNLAQLDFGTSITSGRDVWPELLVRFPITLQLTLIGTVCTIVFAFLASYVASAHPTGLAGRVLRFYARTAGALPDFVLGVGSIFLFYILLRWAPAPIGVVSAAESLPAPVTGFTLIDSMLAGNLDITVSILAHLALPVLVLTVGYAPLIMKILILSLDDAIDAPSTRFRVATGATHSMVVLSIFRKAAPPAVVICGMLFGGLLGGSVVLDQLFSLGGIGQYAVAAISANDFPVLQGFLVLTAAISLVVYLVVDVVNMLLDPRRRPGVAEG